MINFTQTSCEINLDQLIKPYYLSNTEFLKYVLYNIKKTLNNRTVNLIALHGAPIGIPPYSGVVDMIIDQLNLPSQQILIHTRDPNFFNPKITKVDYDLYNKDAIMTIHKYVECWQPMETSQGAKRFGALFGRMQLGRLLLAYYLETEHADKSIVSFLADKIQFEYQIFNMENFFSDIKIWWDNRQNHEVFQKSDRDFGELDYPKNIITYPEVAKLFQIEIISETDYCSMANYTEKTWRCLAIGKPFISLNGPGSLAHLRSLGFETFAPWIDESYDLIPDLLSRIDAIKIEIRRLASLDSDEWQQTLTAMNVIAQRNANYWQHDWVSLHRFLPKGTY